MAYRKMPFGLSNVGTTFQKAMEMAFSGLMNKFVLVYLDDITIFLENTEDHLIHLRQIFERCREFGVSLNAKKCIFAIHEGRLLGHIVSKKETTIDPERVKAILALHLPAHKKGLQSFLGRINFLRRFIPNIAALLKPMTQMLKKNATFHWTNEGKRFFEEFKEEIASTPTLVNPDFSKDFILYSFWDKDSISAILVQHNAEKQEQPVAFYSQGLDDYELNYFPI